MIEGRRPAGICAACLLLAARMNNFRRSLDKIVRVVRIADVTVRKRLEDSKNTASGQMSVEEFRQSWDPAEGADPPAYIESQRKEREATEKSLPAAPPSPNKRPRESMTPVPAAKCRKSGTPAPEPRIEADPVEVQAEVEKLGIEMRDHMGSAEGEAMTHELDEQERWAQEQAAKPPEVEEEAYDALDDLEEEELDQFFLTEEGKGDDEGAALDSQQQGLSRVSGGCVCRLSSMARLTPSREAPAQRSRRSSEEASPRASRFRLR